MGALASNTVAGDVGVQSELAESDSPSCSISPYRSNGSV